MCGTVRTLGIYPREKGILHIPEQFSPRDDTLPAIQPGVRKRWTTRSYPSQTGIMAGLPSVYPIVLIFLSGHQSNSAQKGIPTLTHLGPWGRRASPTHGFLLPWASRACTRHRAHAADPLVGGAVRKVDPGTIVCAPERTLLVHPTHPGDMYGDHPTSPIPGDSTRLMITNSPIPGW